MSQHCQLAAAGEAGTMLWESGAVVASAAVFMSALLQQDGTRMQG